MSVLSVRDGVRNLVIWEWLRELLFLYSEKETVEAVWESDQDACCHFVGVSNMVNWEETLRQTQNMRERSYLLAGYESL